MKIKKLLFLSALFIFLSASFAQAALREEWKDKDGDGKKETHLFYDGKRLIRAETDTNKDGKPDQFYSYYPGAQKAAMREYDRNFDGKIDKRVYAVWDANKTMSIMNGNRMMRIPSPGFAVLWKEEDNSFDGVIDVYSDRENKTKTKVGQKMDPTPVPIDSIKMVEKPAETRGPKKSEAEARIKSLDEQYGLDK